MQFGPSFHKALLALGESPSDQFQRVDAVDGHIPMIIGVEVRQVMGCLGLCEHSNDDSEKPAQFRHLAILDQPRGLLLSDARSGAGSSV